MERFTYEAGERSERLETYEWDRVWWEQTDAKAGERILYIGDSISCAVRTVATEASENTLLFDGVGTSKALDNPYFYDTINLFATQQKQRRAILLNNGLHGWHLSDDGEYVEYYEKMLDFLSSKFAGVPIILLLTTHVLDSERDERVKTRNAAVISIAKSRAIPYIDFYSVTLEHENLISADGVHLTQDGYKLLAETLVSDIKGILSL